MNTKGGEHLSVEEWENLEIDDQRVFLNPISGNKTPAQIIQVFLIFILKQIDFGFFFYEYFYEYCFFFLGTLQSTFD